MEQTNVISKQVNEYNNVDIEQIQDILIVWLDSSIHSNNPDCQNTITQLQQVVTNVHTFTDNDQCIEFILNTIDKKVCMIISGSIGQDIVPCIHDISQIDSIFIFCNNKNQHEQWVKPWFKVKGVSIDITNICQQLQQITRQYEQNTMPMSFVASRKRLDQLEPSFMYTQIIKEILLTITFEDKHIKEFIDYYCDAYVDNEIDRKKVKQLEHGYHQKTPVWWYTTERFLYGMLNRALREMNGEVITLMGFFISDLHQHIEELHKKQLRKISTTKILTVYRGQGMTKRDFDDMVQSKGGLISFLNFLSTSNDRKVALSYAESNSEKSGLIGILFVMKIDPVQSTTPYASVGDISNFIEEDETLFSMHTVFRIDDIIAMNGNERLYEVKLSLTSDNDPELSVLTKRIREESFPHAEGWQRMSLVLNNIGQSNVAERICKVLHAQAINESNNPDIYNQFGSIKYQRGQYGEAIKRYEQALKILQQSLPSNHPNVASSYGNIGNVYSNMGDYSKALVSYEQCLKIQLQSLPSNHPNVASSYNNIGAVYSNMGDYSKALASYEQALKIRQQSLPSNHPDVASSYNNIGAVYSNMGDYSKALVLYEQALKIRQESLPSNHPNVASSYNNIGNVYSDMGDYSKALVSYEQALKIRQQSLPSNHPDVASSYGNIGNVYSKMGDYSKALVSYEQCLKIQLQSLPSNHPNVASSYNNIGAVYSNMGDYSKALASYEQALKIRQQSLPSNHPDVASSYNNIGDVYSNMGDYLNACSFFEYALQIGQQVLPSSHPHLRLFKTNYENARKKL